MAIFRPHPEDSSRAFFNWAHWGVGSSAHMLAGSFVKMLIIKITFTRTNRIWVRLTNMFLLVVWHCL